MSLAASELQPALCEFASGGVTCRGWFYRPDNEPPYACVVMAHGFGAAPDGPLGEMARRCMAAGLAAFTFDFRNFGASEGEPRQLLEINRQLEDWSAAIAYARAREDVDPARVGLWGSSLSGGHTLAVAAADHDLAAVVAQVPYVDGLSLARAAGIAQNLRLLPAVIRDLRRAARGQRPYLIDGLGPPGSLAAISTKFPDLYPAVTGKWPGARSKVAARAVLEMYRFRPILLADQIRCPLLVVLSYEDRVAPPGPAMRAAERLPYVELALLPARHFDLYAGAAHERAAQTEVRFLVHHLHRQDKRDRRRTPARA